MKASYDVVICGAGIAGVSTAYFLAVKSGIKNILLIDERPPLSLTSDKSSECYRNWWSGPDNAMVSLMNRSIDLLEELAYESSNVFNLNRRGYLYLTADREKLPDFINTAKEPSMLGAGPLRIHRGDVTDPSYVPSPPEGFTDLPVGADLFLEQSLIQENFPYLSKKVVAALHVRRAGWFSAQQLGMYMLGKAHSCGVSRIEAHVDAVDYTGGSIRSVHLSNGEIIETHIFVNAAGPHLNNVASLLDIELPVYTELHLKASIRDYLKIVPRSAPLLIWTDPILLPWTDEETTYLQNDPETQWLIEEMPPGVHTRPEGSSDSDILILLWEFHQGEIAPVFPPPLDPQYPEITIRGLTSMLPNMMNYIDRIPRPFLDGGYYTKTKENRPLIGPLPVDGAYVIGALSGYGLMASCAAGELLAQHITSASLPKHAPAFSLSRYQDPSYQLLLSNWGSSGQL